MTEALKFIHLVSLVVWFGSIIFFSFFAAPAIFKSLSREEAGRVVGLIFPKYYIVGYVCGFLSISSLFILGNMDGGTLPTVRFYLLIFMAVVVLYSGIFVGGKARKIKARLRDSDNPPSAEEKPALMKEFGKTHRISMILNLIVFLSSLAVMYMTSQSLGF